MTALAVQVSTSQIDECSGLAASRVNAGLYWAAWLQKHPWSVDFTGGTWQLRLQQLASVNCTDTLRMS